MNKDGTRFFNLEVIHASGSFTGRCIVIIVTPNALLVAGLAKLQELKIAVELLKASASGELTDLSDSVGRHRLLM